MCMYVYIYIYVCVYTCVCTVLQIIQRQQLLGSRAGGRVRHQQLQGCLLVVVFQEQCHGCDVTKPSGNLQVVLLSGSRQGGAGSL